ncbi:MAG: serine/threonine-protein kinase [Phycisphaerae bacterium]|jgi:serine/threonine-protein kinase
MPELREGDRISNYLLEARLGAGTFGEVWRAHHHVFNDVVAIKVPTDAQYVRNLQREGVAVHGLRHPNIVRAIDLDPYADPPYFVMEYVDGPSLRALVDEYGAKFPIPAVVTIMRGILQALTAAHDAGLIHRDLKPANILLKGPTDNPAAITERAIKVTDFGLGHVGGATTQSIMQSGSRLTDEGRSVAGTLAYMSPEQKRGEALDARSDLYACGIILFEMLTGDRPQGNELPRSLRPEVPAHLDEVFKRSYARRERRYQSAAKMLGALDARPPEAAPPPPPTWTPDGRGHACPACQRPVHRDDQFCIMCGQQLVASVPRCNACQAYVHASDHFCIFCGTDLRVLK